MKNKTVYIGIVLILFAAFALLLTGCSEEDFSQTLAEAERVNSESNLGLTFLEPMGLTEEDDRLFTNDRPGGKMTSDGFVKGYYFHRIPEDTDRYLTQIYISGGEYDIFGIKLGTSLESGKKTLEEQGYKKCAKEQTYNNQERTVYGKGRIEIYIQNEPGSDSITAMGVRFIPIRSEAELLNGNRQF